jgi:phage FluMu gp28-like protein
MIVDLPIKNYPKQQEIFDTKARIVSIKKGRRVGFTKGAANNTIRIALAGKKKKGLWVDTVNANIERYVERFFLPTLKLLPDNLWKWRKQQKVLIIRDFYMDFRSSDNPENIEGFGYDYIILNEAGIILKNQYLWSNAIRPMMWDEPQVQAFIGGTPKGGGGAFEDLYQRGLDPKQPNFASMSLITFDNPYITPEEIREDMKSMPQRVIDQEIYGKFLDDTGVVFRGVKDIAILDPKGKDPEQGHMYVIGADLAKLEDFTVIVVYDRATNEQVYQMRFNMIEWPFIRTKIKMVSDKYNKALVMLDGTGVGDPTYDDLQRMGVPVESVKFNNVLKKQMIEKLSNWIEMHYMKMLRLDETIQELSVFTYDISEVTDRIYYGAPQGFHDDIVIAHALACWGLNPIIKPRVILPESVIQKDIAQAANNMLNQQEEGEYGEYDESSSSFY